MSEALVGWVVKGCVALAVSLFLFGGFRWYQHSQREIGRLEVIATAQKAASAAEAVNVATGQARDDRAAQALFRHEERLKLQEADRAKEIADRAADQRLIAGLRDGALAGDRRAPDYAADTCSAEHQQRDAELDRLQREGQILAIRAADLAGRLDELVWQAESGLAGNASVIELANDWAKAVKLGEGK